MICKNIFRLFLAKFLNALTKLFFSYFVNIFIRKNISANWSTIYKWSKGGRTSV